VFRVKGSLSAVMEPRHYLTLQAIKKLKADVVDQMEILMSNSYQCQMSLNKYIREYEPDNETPPSGDIVPSP
jgi:hypothetical protein